MREIVLDTETTGLDPLSGLKKGADHCGRPKSWEEA
jgi:DNA polymerase III epsilon subunit-like protein